MRTINFTAEERKILLELLNEALYMYTDHNDLAEAAFAHDVISNSRLINDYQVQLLKDLVDEAHCFSESSTDQCDLCDIMDKLLGR